MVGKCPLRVSANLRNQYYKVIKGDGTNTIVGEDYQDAKFARKIVSESHGYWQDLMKGKTKPGKIARNQTSNARWRQTYIDSKDATDEFELPAESNILPASSRPAEYDEWYYLDEDFEPIEL